MQAVETEKLSKSYRAASAPAVDGLTLRVNKGELFGFLGPNGAGKTTTIRILTTLLRPTEGRAWVDGYDVATEPLEAMRHVGYMPELTGLYPSLSGTQHLQYWGRLYNIPRTRLSGRITELIRRLGIEGVALNKASTYSLGMKRRLALAGALLSDPDVLILDEPTLGLDPQGVAFMRSLMVEFHTDGRTVFWSSHMLSEVERICTHVGVIQRGRLLRVDTPSGLAHSVSRSRELEVQTRGVKSETLEHVRRVRGVTRVDMRGDTMCVSGALDEDAVVEINKLLVGAGVAVIASRQIEPDLEEAFLTLTDEQT
jgi:ABC-type multidrug transport system ATPase subunit